MPKVAFENTDGLLLTAQGFPLTGQYYQGISGLAKRLCSKYQQLGAEDDFVQVALLTACQYEKKFDATRGAGFYAFVAEPIKTSVQSEFGNQNVGSKVYKKIVKSISDHQELHGIYPTMDDLVIATKLSRFKIMEVYFDRARDVPIESVIEEYSEPEDWVKDHLSILTPEEQKVIDLVFYQGHSLQDVVNVLKVPTKEVSQTLNNALEKLKQSIKGSA